jgi:hypothetical protein
MFRIPATDLPSPAAIDPADLVPLAELVAEGFGYGSPYVATPRDAIDVLAHQLGDQVILDDIGRRCVTRSTAGRMFTERAEAERRQREVQDRNEAQRHAMATANVPRRGVPADRIPPDVLPVSAMLQAARDNEPRRRSVLEEALDNGPLTYHSLTAQEEGD